MNLIALDGFRNGPAIQILPARVAEPLIEGGYLRHASIDPAPKDGLAVNLTAKGRGYVARPPRSNEQPDESTAD